LKVIFAAAGRFFDMDYLSVWDDLPRREGGIDGYSVSLKFQLKHGGSYEVDGYDGILVLHE